jgi:1-acyl-sn-glycerol-3-phosphate acyltransferase
MRWLVFAVYWPGRAVIRAIVLLLVHVEVVGRDNVPRRGAIILVSNHLNNADPPVLGVSIPRRLVFMAKQEAMQWPIVGFIIRLSGAIPVRRFEADIGALRKASGILQGGRALMMFPEGTRSKEARLGNAQPGTALIALRTGSPILPIAITGTESVRFSRLPFDAIRLRRPRIKVVIGNPFFLPSVDRITAEEVNRCTNVIMNRIAALLPPSYRGRYGQADTAESAAEAEGV